MTENSIYYRSISLKNVRCFGSEQTIYFTKNNQPDGEVSMWNVILGKNGVGKTTVLREMVSFIDRSETNYKFLRKDFSFSSSVVLQFQDKTAIKIKDIEVKITDSDYGTVDGGGYSWFPSSQIYREALESLNVFAFGANRKMKYNLGMVANNFITNKRVINLFNENHLLSNVIDWLLQVDYLSLKEKKYKKQFDLVKKVIVELLKTQICDFEIKVEGTTPKVYFSTHYGKVELDDLSLGFKTSMAWITEFVRGLIEYYPNSTNPLSEPAICLIDEIDLHMHPSMQRLLVKFLQEHFPKTQFIVTAHSPLIVQAEEETNVILLRRKDDEVEVVNDMDYVTNWRVDQILNSELFDEVGSYGSHTEEKLKKRREIILKDKKTEADKAELDKIEKSLNNVSVVESPEYLETVKLIEQLRTHAEN